MAIAILFWAMMLLCCGYGALFGGRDGLLIAIIYMVAVLLTVVGQLIQQSWAGVNWPVLLVDFGLLCGLYAVSMRSNRYWPLWITGFHLITMTTHLAALVAPSFAARVYFGMATLWAIPKLLVIVVGVTLDRRAGISDHEFNTA
ncbi:hypothetical protein HFP57_07475 [Parasphingopyxis algicola]|uniref:hypothetical protein n=1 Tax=Parasphingopyxis algicola TaxID=2026624 RepID=UPI0015A02F52|nr:hypothetical protein [Parasphingopyxis algicola]QLC24883.1 hypothetical protein HFP57_07475 [Parasphingopyxis algicola]